MGQSESSMDLADSGKNPFILQALKFRNGWLATSVKKNMLNEKCIMKDNLIFHIPFRCRQSHENPIFSMEVNRELLAVGFMNSSCNSSHFKQEFFGCIKLNNFKFCNCWFSNHVSAPVLNDTIEERVSLLELQVVDLTDDVGELEEDVTIISSGQILQDQRILNLEYRF